MSSELNDLQLLARSRTGDRQALQTLLTLHYSRLVHYIIRRIPRFD